MANSSGSKYKNQVQANGHFFWFQVQKPSTNQNNWDLNLQTNTSLYFAQVTKSALKNSFNVDFTSKEFEGSEISGWSEVSDLR